MLEALSNLGSSQQTVACQLPRILRLVVPLARFHFWAAVAYAAALRRGLQQPGRIYRDLPLPPPLRTRIIA
jgi:hypothetical protein